MKMSFVIPAYTREQRHFKMLFNDCIDSFVKFHGKDHEIIVVEDGGSMKAEVKAECERRGITCVVSEKNCGFPISVNKGIREASGEIIILVNNDIVFTQPVIEPFKKAFEVNGRIGIVGSLLLYPHGTIQHGGIVLVGRGFTHRGWHKTLNTAPEVHHAGYLIGVTGALFGIRKEMVEEIGMFNENYFLACDDTEYCLRAWSRDWRIYYSPAIRAIHAEGATRGRTDIEKIQHHREWYLKEMQTWNKFQTDLVNYDLSHTQEKVAQANAEILGIKIMTTQQGADRIVFEGATVTESTSKAVGNHKILVRRTGALGDVLLATGVIRKLKKDNPNSQIIISTVCGDIFKNNPHVSQVVRTTEGVEADKFYDLDLVYEMNPKMPIWEAYSRAVYGEAQFDATPEMFSTESDYSTLRAKMGSIDPVRDRVVVLHMAVSWSNRTWPRHHWSEVSRRLAGAGYKVVVVGRGGDYRSDLLNNTLNLVDYLNIHEVRELCKRAVAFVGVDSGMLHVAQTTDVPIVGIFTVANPKLRVVGRSSRTIALVPRSECRFCLHEKSPPVTFVECKFGTNHCLSEITPDDVIREVQASARQK